MADMMKQNTKATADALASARAPTSNPSNPPAQTDAPAEDAVSKHDAHIKKYSLHVDSLAFFDPLLICDKHLSKLEGIHMSQNTLRTQLGNGLTVVSNDLNIKIGQAWMYAGSPAVVVFCILMLFVHPGVVIVIIFMIGRPLETLHTFIATTFSATATTDNTP